MASVRIAAVTTVAGLLWVIGCGDGDTASSSRTVAPAAAEAELGCSPPDFERGGTTVLDRVHFFGAGKGWEQGDELQSDPRGGGKVFSKQAVQVSGADLVVFQVPRRARRWVDLTSWGRNTSRFVTDTIRIELGEEGACEGTWPGGFFFSRKGCLELRVKADGRTAEVPFGLGRPC